MIGNQGGDLIDGGAGDDKLFGNNGADRLRGDAGADQISGGSGDDVIRGGLGDDILDGGAGVDLLDYSDAAAGVVIDLDAGAVGDGSGGTDTLVAALGGGSSFEGAIGSSFDDVFRTSGAANFDGGAGSDTVDLSGFAASAEVNLTTGVVLRGGVDVGALSGIEHLIGTAFADVLTGGVGADGLAGGGGGDMLAGQAGDDVLAGGAGDDVLAGGAGFDTADYSAAAAAIFVNLRTEIVSNDGDGGQDALSDIESVAGSNFGDVLIGGSGADTLIGNNGNDRLNGGAGADAMRGGRGNDVYVVDNAGDAVVENSGEGGSDRVLTRIDLVNPDNIELLIGISKATGLTLTGNAGNETIIGTDLVDFGDVINGGAGDDRLIGLVGDDTINGGAGNDRIFGNSGADVISGGGGDDRLTGQFGQDRFVHAPGDGADLITDFDVAEDLLDLTAHGFVNFAEVQALMTDVAGDTRIDLAGGDDILLSGVASGSIGVEDILI